MLDIDKSTDFSYLCRFFDALQLSFNGSVDIFTPNHDRLLEKCFRNLGILFTDGYGEELEDGTRIWTPQALQNENFTKLIKLHGGLDWYYVSHNYILSDISKYNAVYGSHIAYNIAPNILAGTYNKIQDYTRGIFNWLYCEFRRQLRLANRLVVSGYGFGDYGINTAIWEWLYLNKENRIVIIHREPEELKFIGPILLGNHSKDLRRQIIVIKKFVDKENSVTLEEVLQKLSN
jgi:hypothetical protein